MKIISHLKPTEGIDTYCSALGKELSFEDKNQIQIIIPCFNIGLYENEINPDSITKAFNKCYLYLKNVSELHVELCLYHGLFPKSEGTNDLTGDKVSYTLQNEDIEPNNKKYYFEGACFRHNSFSYGSYTVKAESLNIILLDDTVVLKEYNSNDEYKNNKDLKDFLLNKSISNSFFDFIKKTV